MTLWSQVNETDSYDTFNSNQSYSFATQQHNHVFQTLGIIIYVFFYLKKHYNNNSYSIFRLPFKDFLCKYD